MTVKNIAHELGNFIGMIPDFERNLKYLIVHYLKNVDELKKAKEENEDLLTKIEDRDRMIEELEQRINEFETFH